MRICKLDCWMYFAYLSKAGRNAVNMSQMQVILHPTETLQTALVSSRCDLADRYRKYSLEERRLLEEGLHPGDGSLFKPINVHSDSDWIPSHPEEPQDFQSFYSNPYRSTPIKGHSTIYIQIIGSFGEAEAETGQYVEWLRDYCQAFYYGLLVKLLPPLTVAATGCVQGQQQFTQPTDPHRSYAGRLKKGIKPCQGDYSMFEGYYSPPITSTLLLRSCKTVTHEIGHIFGVKHCQWIQCVMQGSNHLEESDSRPLDLCPVYLRKLQSAIGFKIANRYKTWIEEEGAASPGQPTVSQSDSEPHCPKPTLAFQNSRQWLRRCLEILEKVIF